MRNYFLDIVSIVNASLNGEKFTLWFSAEKLDYTRFNNAKIRQAGTVVQQYIDLNLINGQRHASASIGLSQNLAADKETITFVIKDLREQIKKSNDDPYLMIHEGNTSSEHVSAEKDFDKQEIVEAIVQESKGLDLVGYYFGGPVYRGFANSYGQINWFSEQSFIIDTSVYHSGDKAIKQSYASTNFSRDLFAKKIEEARLGLSLFDKGVEKLSTGSYRVYFSPSAVNELISMINWGGLSQKSIEVKNSPLLPLCNKEKAFSKDFCLYENVAEGIGPNFQSQGFLKKDRISIIENGTLNQLLISPKTAKEYHLDHNGADDSEAMCAIDMRGGDLANDNVLSTLSDGLYVNNLWYLNYSDRYHGCLTGMTRFFCYTVKNGKPDRAFSVMRFDDSIYRLFGENLKHLTKERELIIDNSTYDERSTSSALLPGIIVDDVRFTL